MRTIDAAMQTSLASLTRRPAFTLTAEDHIQHLQQYQVPAGLDTVTDACIAADGSIIRCYVSRSGFTSTAFVQRITDPSIASQWTTWITLGGSPGNMFADGGIAVSNNGGPLRVFCQRGTGGNQIWYWQSLDNGQNWSVSPLTAVTPAGGAQTKGLSSAGNNDLFFLYDVVGGDAMGYTAWNGTSWSAINTWPFAPLIGGLGLAAAWISASNTYYIVHSNGYALANVAFNPSGPTWTGMGATPVCPATSTAIIRSYPRVSLQDGVFSLTCVEIDLGTLTGITYNYPRVRQSIDMVHWSDGFLLHWLTTNFAANYFKLAAPQTGASGARWYGICMGNVYSAKVYSGADPTMFADISAPVLGYTRKERQAKPSELTVIIDNTGGAYNSLVNVTPAGPYQPLGRNTTLVLSEGYKTGSPPTTNDVIATGKYRVNSIQFKRTPQENQITIIAYDLSKNLDLNARYQNSWTNQNLAWLVTEVCARAGIFNVSLPGTTQTIQQIPTFTIHAGLPYRQALDELCQTYGLAYFMDQAETMQFRELSGSDPSVLTYQPEIELVSFGMLDVRANHVIVSGKPPAGGQSGALTESEAYDDNNMMDVQVERLLHHTDQKLTTNLQCSYKAAFIMIQEQRNQTGHVVTVPLNPALQLLDVITLTDSVAPTGSGQSSVCRIDAVTAQFDAQHAIYDLHLSLEGQ